MCLLLTLASAIKLCYFTASSLTVRHLWQWKTLRHVAAFQIAPNHKTSTSSLLTEISLTGKRIFIHTRRSGIRFVVQMEPAFNSTHLTCHLSIVFIFVVSILSQSSVSFFHQQIYSRGGTPAKTTAAAVSTVQYALLIRCTLVLCTSPYPLSYCCRVRTHFPLTVTTPSPLSHLSQQYCRRLGSFLYSHRK